MIVFINGSINSGKTTTGKLLAEELNVEFLDFDTISEAVPGFDVNVKEHLPAVFDEGIRQLNALDLLGKSAVATYVFNQEEHDRLQKELTAKTKWVTLAPPLKIAQSQRGDRVLSNWERQRVKYHYETGVANPNYGVIIDNSQITPAETVEKIIKMLKLSLT